MNIPETKSHDRSIQKLNNNNNNNTMGLMIMMIIIIIPNLTLS